MGTKRYIDLSNISELSFGIDNFKIIDETNAPSRAQQLVRTEDVIFATTRPLQMKFALCTCAI
jgi:type I restriction enzyme S subunit